MKTNTPTERGIEIGNNIYKLLAEKGKTQREASKEMNISYSALSAWITGKRIPRMDNVDTLYTRQILQNFHDKKSAVFNFIIILRKFIIR